MPLKVKAQEKTPIKEEESIIEFTDTFHFDALNDF